MKTEIKVAVSYVKVTHEIKTVDLPEVTRFYRKGTGEYASEKRLFAIILYGTNPQSGHYNLIQVSNGIQLSDDFIPRKDVSSEFWVDGNRIRKTALEIIDKSSWAWEEITKDEFLLERMEMLNKYIEEL